MRNVHLLVLVNVINLAACVTPRVSQQEAVLLPDGESGKWWVINTISQDRYGRDVHFNSLVSIDKTGEKKYASCFVSVWSATAQSCYTATRNTPAGELRFNRKFPVKISFPANNPPDMDWRLVLKRNKLDIFFSLNDKTNVLPKGYTGLSASFPKQNPFAVSVIRSSPKAWAVNPVRATVKLEGNVQASAPDNLLIRVFSDKDLLLKKSSSAFVHWLDLSLQSGKHLSVLFSTDASSNTDTEAVLLWDEQGNIMARPEITLKKINSNNLQAGSLTKPYPLFFSIELPGQHVQVLLQPRMVQQEIAANKNSVWLGAVEALDVQSGRPAGKGNMFIFKQ